MTGQIPANAQGELQGAMSCLNSIASIIGPVMLTQLFSRFTSAEAPVYFPGIPFLAAALLTLICLTVFSFVVIRHGISGQLRN